MLFLNRLLLLFNSPAARLRVIFWGIMLPFFCYASLWALGRGDLKDFGYCPMLCLTLYALHAFSRRGFSCYLWFTFIISLCYLPAGMIYGKLNFGIIISLYETDNAETWEYIQGVPASVYFAVILYIFLFYIVLKTHRSLQSPARVIQHYLLLFLIVMAMIFQPARYFYKRGAHVSNLRSTKIYPFKFLFTYLDYYSQYHKQKQLIEKAQKAQPTWLVRASTPKYRNYVLVIGESMRRDYASVYGYPINTTPFLKNVNGVFLSHYSSPAYNTPLSLQRMLIQQTKPEIFIYPNTAITLAKRAGFKTFWLANQGIFSEYNTTKSSVAMRADNSFFAKKGNFKSNNKSDLDLLPALDEALASGANQPRLIALHLVGSHPTFCKRLDKAYHIKNFTHVINDELSCYLSTFRQTDKLLENIYKRLQAKNEPFSILYFSDHGLARVEKLQSVTLKHNNHYRQNYDVPFIVISSDDRERTVITAPKSGYDFMVGFAEWLGIDEVSLAEKPRFFSNQTHGDIKVFDGHKIRNYESLDNDPVMLP